MFFTAGGFAEENEEETLVADGDREQADDLHAYQLARDGEKR